MFCNLLTGAVLALAMVTSAQAGDDLTRQANFAAQNQQTWELESPMGRIEIYFDEEARTQFRGTFQGTAFGSEVPEDSNAPFLPFTRKESGQQDGQAYLTFEGPYPQMTLTMVQRYGVDAMPSQQRAFWQQLSPGCIQEDADGAYMPTAVILVTEAGANPMAAFADTIPLR